ncbi:MAG: YfhO family protein, partial [Nanoarchaeota archaeon]
PRIYFASGIKFTDAQSAWNELLNIKNFSNVTLIECQENCPDSGIAHKSDSITIEGFRPQEVKIKATNTSGRWLIYSDANLPTWGVYINNQKTPIYTANYLFKSVFVPKGEHEIVFKYPNLWGQFKYAFENFILGRQ